MEIINRRYARDPVKRGWGSQGLKKRGDKGGGGGLVKQLSFTRCVLAFILFLDRETRGLNQKKMTGLFGWAAASTKAAKGDLGNAEGGER